jgi:hypothetical protein
MGAVISACWQLLTSLFSAVVPRGSKAKKNEDEDSRKQKNDSGSLRRRKGKKNDAASDVCC